MISAETHVNKEQMGCSIKYNSMETILLAELLRIQIQKDYMPSLIHKYHDTDTFLLQSMTKFWLYQLHVHRLYGQVKHLRIARKNICLQVVLTS